MYKKFKDDNFVKIYRSFIHSIKLVFYGLSVVYLAKKVRLVCNINNFNTTLQVCCGLVK